MFRSVALWQDDELTSNTGHNNGGVTQTIDGVLGETVTYQYDHLHRLTAATATNSAWGEAYSYDGFGNLTAKTPTVGSAPTFAGSTGSNVQNGYLPGQWDVENRPMTQGSTFYVYDPWGRRIWKQWTGQTGANECEAYFYGATGQKLESYSCEYTPNTTDLFTTLEGINTYFGGKMLSEKGVFVATDRLGSVRGNSSGESFSYFPWGEERGAGTADGRTKFAGYYRDQPGQDYAMARYYSATTGSFWSPDPGGMKNANPLSPLTWNRYGYVMGDPINRTDVRGLCSDQDDPPCYSTTATGEEPPPPPPVGNPWDPNDPNAGPGANNASDPSCSSLLSAAMTTFLTNSKSPLLTQDPNFVSQIVTEAAAVGVDPRLFVAETEESGLGTSHVAQTMNNPFGIKRHNKNVSFSSVGDAIVSEGSTLNQFVNIWNETVSQMYSGLPGVTDAKGWNWVRPPAYCQGSGCQAFGSAVAGALKAMGGDPNSLKYPLGQVSGVACKD